MQNSGLDRIDFFINEGQSLLREADISDAEILEAVILITQQAGTAVHTMSSQSAQSILRAAYQNQSLFTAAGGSDPAVGTVMKLFRTLTGVNSLDEAVEPGSVIDGTFRDWCKDRRDAERNSVVHESRTPYSELGYLGFFADLGRTYYGFDWFDSG
jgi:hypothetical protein